MDRIEKSELCRKKPDQITYDGTNAVEVLEFLNGFRFEGNSDFNGGSLEWNRGGLTHTIPIGSIVKSQWDIERPRPTTDNGSGAINHPSHYGGDTTYEAIKVIEAWEADFCIGNTLKYLSRAGKKNDELEDLKKAQWYLERKIKQLEKL